MSKFKLNKKEFVSFIILWSLCALSAFLVLPYYISFLQKLEMSDFSTGNLIFSTTINSFFVYPFFIYFAFLIKRYISVPEIVSAELMCRKSIGLAVTVGLCVGVFLQLIDTTVFHPFLPGLKELATRAPGPFYGFLAGFYGGIFEETMTRFFFMSLLLLLLKKSKMIGVWVAIVLSAFIFAVAHLPQMSMLVSESGLLEMSDLLVARAIFLNFLPGIIFGWFYWKKGLGFSIVMHFMADIVLHVIVPLF